jgi:hypothetical protein
MQDLQRWLMKTNAKAVFACFLVGLLAVSGLWYWRLQTPLDPHAPLPGGGKAGKGGGLGLLAILNGDLERPFVAPESPFRALGAPPVVVERKHTVRDRPRFYFPRRPIHRPDPEPEPEPKVVSKPKETIRVTYHGFMRIDGRDLAWIEDSKTGRRGFYAAGSELHGMKIESISTNQVNILVGGNESMDLNLNESGVVQVDSDGN